MQRTPAATPSEISELAHCCAVFVPGDSARTGRVAFWRLGDAPPTVAAGTVDELTVVSAGAGGVERIRVPAVLLPVRAALPVLTRARAAAQAYRARAFRGTAAVLGLQLVARGLRLPGLSAANHGAWWARPLSASDVGEGARTRRRDASGRPCRAVGEAGEYAATEAARPGAAAARLPGRGRRRTAQFPRRLSRRRWAAYAVREPQHMPERRAWTAEIAAGHDAGVRISLRVEAQGLATAGPDEAALGRRAVLQVPSVSEPGLVADAADVWAVTGAPSSAFGPRARMDALLALRRAARLQLVVRAGRPAAHARGGEPARDAAAGPRRPSGGPPCPRRRRTARSQRATPPAPP